MLFFTRYHFKKLQQAIIDGDLALLKKQFGKLDQASLQQERFCFQDMTLNAQELAIQAGQPKALEHLLSAGLTLESSTALPLLYQALRQQEQSLALLTVLLQAGAPFEYPEAETDYALQACFKYCSEDKLMLHLSRLNEYGADLNRADAEENTALILALKSNQQALVQMLINSGAALPENLAEGICSDELRQYAKRCSEDLRIRQMMLG